tara:strand:- start:1366 stop:2352 length:987 start_codon:yes stop_codon:yes gene_type:complete
MKIKDKEFILVTGCAGFIGFHLTKLLLSKNKYIIGVDMINHYYDVKLKNSRLKELKRISNKKLIFYKCDIQNFKKMDTIFKKYKITKVVNLAAQAGVRDAIRKPKKYLNYNINGFLNILNLCKDYQIKHLIYASTSSVYGLNKKRPFSEKDKTDSQNQFYAVTKKTNELMANVWGQIYNLPTTGLRFFTVYGPWGRPDMALFKFTKNIINGDPIYLHNYGNHMRDFTYIDDIVNGIYLSLKKTPQAPSISKIYNLGFGKAVSLKYFLNLIEKYTNKKAIVVNLPMQLGDILKTNADISLAKKELGYKPNTKIDNGLKNFIKWYTNFYN